MLPAGFDSAMHKLVSGLASATDLPDPNRLCDRVTVEGFSESSGSELQERMSHVELGIQDEEKEIPNTSQEETH